MTIENGGFAFETAVDQLFRERPCEDAGSAKRALLILYDLIAEMARKATAAEEGSRERNEGFYFVQQVICFTPLRLFLWNLTADPLLPIRASAKGEICDRTAFEEFGGDPEVGIISYANLAVMFNPPAGDPEPRLKEAMDLWRISTQGLDFTPRLKIHVLNEPPSK